MNENIIDYLLKIKDSLPKKLKILSNYIIINYQHISLMSVAELAKNANVSTTTVMRLLDKLHCVSFSDFKSKLVHASINSNISSYGSLKNSLLEENAIPPTTFQDVVNDSIYVLEHLYNSENLNAVSDIANKLITAKSIYTLGIRSSKSLALYFEYSLNTVLPKVRQLSNETEFLFDNITLNVDSKDILVIFSVWPSTRKSIKAAELCYKKHVPIVLITNTNINPMTKYATTTINTNAINHISGNVAITSIIETLVAEVGRQTAPNSTKNIEKIESVLDENDIIIWEN